MQRTIATHVVMLVVGGGLGIGAVAAAQQGPPVARSAAADTRIVKQLQQLNGEVRWLNRYMTGSSGDTYWAVRDGDVPPPATTIEELLTQICRNTTATLSSC